jgi:hypothetical protein
MEEPEQFQLNINTNSGADENSAPSYAASRRNSERGQWLAIYRVADIAVQCIVLCICVPLMCYGIFRAISSASLADQASARGDIDGYLKATDQFYSDVGFATLMGVFVIAGLIHFLLVLRKHAKTRET